MDKTRTDILQDLWQDQYPTLPGVDDPKTGKHKPASKRFLEKARINDNECVGSSAFGVKMPEGRFVLDFDSKESHDEFVSRFGRIPEVMNTYIVKSPKGYHYYYKGAFKGRKTQQGPHKKLDIIGEGFFVWGPSSKRLDGQEYIIEKDLRVAQAPDDLMKWIQDQINNTPKNKENKNTFAEEGERHTTIRDAIHDLRTSGYPSKQTLTEFMLEFNYKYCEVPQDDEEIISIIDHDWEKYSRQLDDHTKTYIDDKSLALGVEEALKVVGYYVRENTRSKKREWSKDRGITWEASTDGIEATVWNKIQEQCELKPEVIYKDSRPKAIARVYSAKNKSASKFIFSQAEFRQGLEAVAMKYGTDPFVDYLESLRSENRESTPTINGYLNKMFVLSKAGRDDYQEYYDWVFKATLVAAIARAYEPGVEKQDIPVLVGPQGVGKTSLWRNLVPMDEFYEGDFSFTSPNTKERVEATLGKVLVEWSELDGVSERNLEKIKTYISLNQDSATRLAYRKNAETIKRNFMLVATANDGSALTKDNSGARRFCVVNINDKNVNDEVYLHVRRDRDTLWAEALYLYENGFDYTFDHKGKFKNVHMDSVNVNHEGNEVLAIKLQNWHDGLTELQRISLWLMTDICREINWPGYGLEPHTMQQRELANELRATLGWEKKQIRAGSKNANFWFLPVNGNPPKRNGQYVVYSPRTSEEAKDV